MAAACFPRRQITGKTGLCVTAWSENSPGTRLARSPQITLWDRCIEGIEGSLVALPRGCSVSSLGVFPASIRYEPQARIGSAVEGFRLLREFRPSLRHINQDALGFRLARPVRHQNAVQGVLPVVVGTHGKTLGNPARKSMNLNACQMFQEPESAGSAPGLDGCWPAFALTVLKRKPPNLRNDRGLEGYFCHTGPRTGARGIVRLACAEYGSRQRLHPGAPYSLRGLWRHGL
jgi:hypothetical protein